MAGQLPGEYVVSDIIRIRSRRGPHFHGEIIPIFEALPAAPMSRHKSKLRHAKIVQHIDGDDYEAELLPQEYTDNLKTTMTRRGFLTSALIGVTAWLFGPVHPRLVCKACGGDPSYRIRSHWRHCQTGQLMHHDRPCCHCHGSGQVTKRPPGPEFADSTLPYPTRYWADCVLCGGSH